jgi:hypothetical protein
VRVVVVVKKRRRAPVAAMGERDLRPRTPIARERAATRLLGALAHFSAFALETTGTFFLPLGSHRVDTRRDAE